MKDFFPDAIRTPAIRDAGNYTGGGRKIVHHSTEGSSFSGAHAAFRAHDDLPHFTDTFEGGVYRVHQHVPNQRHGHSDPGRLPIAAILKHDGHVGHVPHRRVA